MNYDKPLEYSVFIVKSKHQTEKLINRKIININSWNISHSINHECEMIDEIHSFFSIKIVVFMVENLIGKMKSKRNSQGKL